MRSAIVNSLVLFLVSGVALAGDLASDPNALVYDGTTWCGSANVSAGPNGAGKYLNATIDYCVYAPGQFSYPDQGYTPTSGEFVYAYQVFIDDDVEVFKFLVGMLESNEANNIGTWSMTGGLDPNAMGFGGTPPNLDSAWWSWDPAMQPTEKSVGLAFSSINAPLWWIGTVHNSGLQASAMVPSPSDVIPEPATLCFLLAGAVVGGLRRRR
jgi:hypothetical protein